MDKRDRLKIIKQELARLSGSKRARKVDWSVACPTQWQEVIVMDPRTGMPFTPSGAWEFIAEELSKPETVIREVELRKPKGKKGYEFEVRTPQGDIYVKLQFGQGGKIKGRSFHY